MEMKSLKNTIIDAASDERFRESEITGAINHSDHESLGYIRCKFKDASDSRDDVFLAVDTFEMCVRADNEDSLEMAAKKKQWLEKIEQHSLLAAAEFVQLAAAARKAINTINVRIDEEEQE